MQCLEVSCAVRHIHTSFGAKGLKRLKVFCLSAGMDVAFVSVLSSNDMS